MDAALKAILFGANNPVIDLDASGGFYQLGGQRFSDPTQTPGWSFARATVGRSLDGTVGFASGLPRIVPGSGILVEEARTNLFLNSSAPVTQDVTITATTYVVSVWGSGSVAVTAGTATATGYATASAGSPVTIVCTVGGTITCTVSGSPTYVQVEAGTFGTSPIVTAGASATRAADVGYIDLTVPAQWTLYGQATFPANDAAANKNIGGLSAGSTLANRTQLFRNTGAALDCFAQSGGANVYEQTTAASGAITAAAAISHDGTSYRAAARGAALASTAAAAPIGLSRLWLGVRTDGTVHWTNGYIRRLTVYPFAMSTAQMQGLTA